MDMDPDETCYYCLNPHATTPEDCEEEKPDNCGLEAE